MNNHVNSQRISSYSNERKHVFNSITNAFANLYLGGFLILFISHADMAFGGRAFDILPSPTLTFMACILPILALIFSRILLSKEIQRSVILTYQKNSLVAFPFVFLTLCALVSSLISRKSWPAQIETTFLSIYALFVLLSSFLLPLMKTVRKNFKSYILICWLASISAISIDLIFPGTFSHFTTRAAGLEADSNTSSFLINSFCGIFLRYDQIRVPEIFALLLTIIFIVASTSRSGIILFFILLLFYLLKVVDLRKLRLDKLILSSLIAAFLLQLIRISVSFLFQSSDVFAAGTQSRLQTIEGDDPRIILLRQYLDWMADSPFIGYGTGFAESQILGAHNMYLQLGVSNGILASLCYFLVISCGFYLFWKRQFNPGIIFMIQLFFYSLFSHNVMRFRSIFILLGTLCTFSLIYEQHENRRT